MEAITLFCTVSGFAITGAWYLGTTFSRIKTRLNYLEKAVDDLRVDIKEIIKTKTWNNSSSL